MLKNCTSPYRSKMMQYEYKKENRKDRYKAKKDIQEGIQEYESRDNLSCSSCIFYDGGLCEKGLLMTDESIYFDSDEEMEGWFESFRQEFGKPFIYIE